MKTKVWLICIFAAVVALSAGCAGRQAAPPAAPATPTEEVSGATEQETEQEAGNDSEGQATDPGVVNAPNTTPAASDQGTGEQEVVTETIRAYYTDTQLMQLIETNKEITYPSQLEKYMESFKTLQKSDSEDQLTLWSDQIVVHQIKFEQGKLTFDIALPDEARLGSGGEALAIEAFKQTMFQFDEVKSLDLLVDGKALDSLMGHVELEHPMTQE